MEVEERLPQMPSSSSAKADDPVRRAVSYLTQVGDYRIPAFRGYDNLASSAFADDDDHICARKLRWVNYSRPAALDDRGGALGEQFEADRAAEFAGVVRWPGARGLDEQAARFVQHRGGQRHLRTL